jgi:8-oxo-dGTP pyrophosphatase MutT (NUDIX family)
MPQQFFVGVKAVIRQDEKYLVLKHDKGHWDLPGGRIDGNETIEEALLRELAEEIPNIRGVKVGKQIMSYRVPGKIFGETGLVLLCYEVEISRVESIELGQEHTGYYWMTSEEIKKLPSDILRVLAKQIS